MTSNINSSQNDQDDMNIYITPTGEKRYFNNKKSTLYIERVEGEKEWFECDKYGYYQLHREDGLPARIYKNRLEYWIHGELTN